MKFPKYGEVAAKSEKMMNYPKDWKAVETKFDQEDLIKPVDYDQSSLTSFCVSDFYIIQKWIDYAKAIEDPSAEIFHFPECYA